MIAVCQSFKEENYIRQSQRVRLKNFSAKKSLWRSLTNLEFQHGDTVCITASPKQTKKKLKQRSLRCIDWSAKWSLIEAPLQAWFLQKSVSNKWRFCGTSDELLGGARPARWRHLLGGAPSRGFSGNLQRVSPVRRYLTVLAVWVRTQDKLAVVKRVEGREQLLACLPTYLWHVHGDLDPSGFRFCIWRLIREPLDVT